MRLFPLAALVAMTATAACALDPDRAPDPDPGGIDWHLLAVDGQVIDYIASLRIEADGTLGGQAPCNRWSSQNTADWPDLALGGIRATRMACDRLADEQAFFAALARMTRLEMDGERTLILIGPEGRRLEFVRDRTDDGQTVCKTCPSGN